MSTFVELVNSLCPDGVPHIAVSAATVPVKISRGVQRSEYSLGKAVPIIDQGQSKVVGYTDDLSIALPRDEYIVFGDHTRIVKWINFEFAPGADGIKVLRPTASFDAKYLFHAISNLKIADRGYNRHWTLLRELTVPCPPIAVQLEVVRLLDQLASRIEGLERALLAERHGRESQYSFYRRALLSHDLLTTRWSTMGEVFEMRAGKFIAAAEISQIQDSEHKVACFGGNGMRGYVRVPNHEEDHVLIGRQGALCGNIKRANGPFYATEHAVVVTPIIEIDRDWSFYMLDFMNLNQYATRSAQPGLAIGSLEKVPFPIPPLAEQRRIAATLERYSVEVRALGELLADEAASRHLQFEYFRQRLLAFEEKVA